MDNGYRRAIVWFAPLALAVLALAWFPAFFLDSTALEYNRLPVDGLPNTQLYDDHRVKRVDKIPGWAAPHDGPPTRSGWESPVVYHAVISRYANLV